MIHMKNKLLALMLIMAIIGFVLSYKEQNRSVDNHTKSSETALYGDEYKPSKDQFYRPTHEEIKKLKEKPHFARIADWDYFRDNESLKITSIEFHGFWKFNEWEKLSFATSDKKLIKLFQAGLKLDDMSRIAVSDVTNPGAYYRTDILVGVIYLHTPQKKIVIGISPMSFHLGTTATNTKTGFRSWILTKALDDALKSEKGINLDEDTFDMLSGLYRLKYQQERYNDIIDPTNDI